MIKSVGFSTLLFLEHLMTNSPLYKNATIARAMSRVYKLTNSREVTAKVFGVAGPTVINTLRKAGFGHLINSPGKQATNMLSPASLVNQYWKQNMSLRQIAAKAGTSHSTVANRMAAYKIPTRSPAV